MCALYQTGKKRDCAATTTNTYQTHLCLPPLQNERICDNIFNNIEPYFHTTSQHKENIDEIFVSMDSHHRMHIAHGIFWMDAEGASPAPYTVILNADVEAGLWRPRDDAPDILDYVKYVRTCLCEYVHLLLSLLPHCHVHPLTPSPTHPPALTALAPTPTVIAIARTGTTRKS